MTASRTTPRAAIVLSAGSRPRAWKSTRSRRSTGAVRWLRPTSSRCISEIVALREEIADRHEIQQHDRKAERREVRRAPPAPPNPPRREQLERIHAPAHERDEDLRVV